MLHFLTEAKIPRTDKIVDLRFSYNNLLQFRRKNRSQKLFYIIKNLCAGQFLAELIALCSFHSE